jgi:SpoVK/Ycf46/Vps4 family AAA+-type ATPase
MSSYFDDAETVMRRVFDLATVWGAIILIDEADVFMVKRGNIDNHRNGLVATFLRMLEYHEGILFLTSNRLEDFDEAFESRLHLRLRYPPLDIDKKERIWRTALTRVPETQNWTAEDFRRLATKFDINGRQITNLVRTALALSTYNKVPLTVETLIHVQNLNFGHGHNENDRKL